MPPFIITLPNEKEKSYRRIANFIFVLNGILLASTLVAIKLSTTQQIVTVISLLLITTTLVTTLAKYNHRKIEFLSLLSYFVSILYWVILGFWWIAAALVILILLYHIAKRTLRITVKKEGVLYPAWPEKKINWPDLNNLILKDGLLTIDFKNDKIIQHIIDEKETAVDEKEFNEFCRQQLN